MAGATDGTAGGMLFWPFTGEMELLLPCCGVEPPTATGGEPDAIGGEKVFVALAYERAVGWAEPAATGDVVPEVAEEAAFADCTVMFWVFAGEIALVISLLCGGWSSRCVV